MLAQRVDYPVVVQSDGLVGQGIRPLLEFAQLDEELHLVVLGVELPQLAGGGPVLFKSCGWAGWDLAAARAAMLF